MGKNKDVYQVFQVLKEFEKIIGKKGIRISTRAWKSLLKYLQKFEVPEVALGTINEEVNQQLREIYESVGELANVPHFLDVSDKNGKPEISVRVMPRYTIIQETGEVVDTKTGEVVDRLTKEQIRDFSLIEYESKSYKNDQTI